MRGLPRPSRRWSRPWCSSRAVGGGSVIFAADAGSASAAKAASSPDAASSAKAGSGAKKNGGKTGTRPGGQKPEGDEYGF